MSLEFVRKLPTPTEIREQYPLSARATEIKKQRDAEIAKVFTGDSDKFLVIVGPCSADNEDAVLEYNHRLAKAADKVSDKLIIIPRVYTNKPRTTGEGYKGIVHQPDPEGKPDLLHGLIAMRKMHMRVVEETDLTSADEMLYPVNLQHHRSPNSITPPDTCLQHDVCAPGIEFRKCTIGRYEENLGR